MSATRRVPAISWGINPKLSAEAADAGHFSRTRVSAISSEAWTSGSIRSMDGTQHDVTPHQPSGFIPMDPQLNLTWERSQICE